MEDWRIQIGEGDHGVLSAFWRVWSQKRTGILIQETPSSGREGYRKEVVFQAGEPVAAMSNRVQETFGGFLVEKGRLSLEQSKALQEEARRDNVDLAQKLLSSGQISSSEINEILESFLRAKIFSSVAATRGSITFKNLNEVPAKVFERNPVRLSAPFSQIFWAEAKPVLSVEYCKARLSKRAGQSLRIRGDCPFNLGSSDLREWNAMTRAESLAISQSFGNQQLLVLAVELEQVVWGESPAQKLKNEIYVLLQKYKKSTPFEILGIPESASVEEYKKAHLHLIKKYHPDRLPPDSDKDLRSQCEHLLAQINEAYDLLSDPIKRDEFFAERELEKFGGRKGIEEQLRAETLYDEGVQVLRRKQYRQAFDIFKSVESKLQENLAFKSDQAFSKLMMDVEMLPLQKAEGLRAMAIFDESIARDKENIWPLFYKGMVLRLLGEFDKAIDAFEELLDRNPRMNEAASELRFLRTKQEKDREKKAKGGSWFKKS